MNLKEKREKDDRAHNFICKASRAATKEKDREEEATKEDEMA